MSEVRVMTNSVAPKFDHRLMTNSLKKKFENAASVVSRSIVGNSNVNMKNAEFVSRSLTYIFSEILFQRFPEYTYRLYVDILNTSAFNKNVAFNIANFYGEATEKSSSANDFDDTDVNMVESMFDLYQLNTQFTLETLERMAAESLAETDTNGVKFISIVRAKMTNLIRVTEGRKNYLFFNGNSESGMTGIINDTDIPSSTASAAWTTATDPNVMLNDLMNAITQVRSQSKGVFEADTFAISNNKYAIIQGKARSLYSDFTILNWVKTNLPQIKTIIPDPYLDNVGSGSTGMIIALEKDYKNANMVVGADLMGLPVQYQGQRQVNPFISRLTGLNLLQSNSIYRYSGI